MPVAGWRVLPFHVLPAAEQLHLTETLGQEVASGRAPATLRWYSYDTPALVLGIGQAATDVNLAAVKKDGVAIVKRASGGAVVFARPGFLALDIALPMTSPLVIPDVVESYRWLGAAFAEALTLLAPTHAKRITLVTPAAARADQSEQRGAPPATPNRDRSVACFGVLSPYEVALAMDAAPLRKVIGFSQIRKRGVTLFQAGVYATFSGEELACYLSPTVGLGTELDRRIADLAEINLTPAHHFVTAVTNAIERAASTDAE